MPGVQLAWARSDADLHGADWIVLPGSKQVSGDLAWLRRQRLDGAIARHAAAGRPVLGICGGLQMLGEALIDPEGHDGEAGFNGPGLGLLPLVTRYERDKRVRRTRLRFRADRRAPGRPGLASSPTNYEDPLRASRPVPHTDLPAPRAALRDVSRRIPSAGNAATMLERLRAWPVRIARAAAPDAGRQDGAGALDDSFVKALADLVDEHLDNALLDRLLCPGR